MKKRALLLLIIFSFILNPSLRAAGGLDGVYDAANSESYGTKFSGMLGRGLVNVATSFVDIIVHVVEGSKQGPPVVGSLTGLGSGLACSALRVTSGALDVTTFWVPGFNGFPVSRSYSNCLNFESEELEVRPQELGQPPVVQGPVGYAKPSAPAKHDTMEYVKK